MTGRRKAWFDALARAGEPPDEHHPEPPEDPELRPKTPELLQREAMLEAEAADDPERATLAEKDAHGGRKAKADARIAETLGKTTATEQVEPPGGEAPEEEAGVAQMAEPPRHRRDELVWVLAAAGPFVWLLDLVIAWAVTPAAHHTARLTTLRLIHAGALVLTIATIVLAVVELRRMPKPPHTHVRDQRALLFNVSAVVLAALSCLLVLGNLIVTFLMVPGAEP